MQPDPGRSRFEGRHALRQQPTDKASKNITGASGREPGWRIIVDRRATVWSSDDGIGALENDDGSCTACCLARPLKLRSGRWLLGRAKEPGELPFMRREDRAPPLRSLDCTEQVGWL